MPELGACRSGRQKKSDKVTTHPARAEQKEVRPIRLMPSSSDYATFARTTATVMGKTVANVSQRKPDKYLLSLLILGC